MVRQGYRNISIPQQLYEELENFIKKKKGRYVSIAEVIRVAVREFLDRQEA